VHGADVVEIGGGLSGFQFVLAKCGARVRNVDPGEAATGRGWPVSQGSIARLNRAFKTDVELLNTTLPEARLERSCADLVFSISTIEHIPPDDVAQLMREITRLLRPGGRCVLTVDLFLNLHPFSSRTENEFGTNVAPALLIAESGLQLVVGEPSELFGFPEFEPPEILARLDEFLINEYYPVLAQCLVLEKPLDV
jgi:SAM-dependent methyltransferase